MGEASNVVIYSTESCNYCKMAKEFLASKDIAYTEHDVTNDPVKRQEMMQKTGQMGVPVIQVENEIMVGFDKNKLAGLLGISA